VAAAVSDTRVASGTYVYGVVRGVPAIGRRGVADAKVGVVEHDGLAALVSGVDAASLRAKRRDLVAHQEVLQEAFESGPVLPLRFGTVFRSDEAVRTELLAARSAELSRLLARFESFVELSVRAYYVEDAVLREIVEGDREVARLKGRASDVALGEAVAHALSARRAADARAIEHALLPFAEDAAVDPPRTEFEVFRGAFLVEREAVTRFDRAMDELARKHDATLVFKYVGPLPPHSFVDAGSAGA